MNTELFPVDLVPVPFVITRSLESIAAGINAAHRESWSHAARAIERALEAGELLLTVKARLKHGEFGPWCKENCPDISPRTIQNYMRVARELPAEKRNVAHLGLREALRLVADDEDEPETARS